MILLGLLAGAIGADAPPTGALEPPAVLARPALRYPEIAKALPLPPVLCDAEVTLDADGRVSEVVLPRCPDPFGSFAEADLSTWAFRPARVDGVPTPTVLTISLRWQRDPKQAVASPDLAQWAWTDEALTRLGRQDFVMGVGSIGLSMVGAALVALAAWGEPIASYRGRYLTAGSGLILFSVFGLNAVASFDRRSVRRRQRALWATFHPAPPP